MRVAAALTCGGDMVRLSGRLLGSEVRGLLIEEGAT
jgi:hypothetical protein